MKRSLAEHFQALASRSASCGSAQAATTIGGNVYIGCSGGEVVELDDDGRLLDSADVSMDGVNSIVPAGMGAIAVQGYLDGAALRNGLTFLRVSDLKPIVKSALIDSTFLGMIGGRAFIDDWCCNGRPDTYRPATIYWISLFDGSQGAPIDLMPDANVNRSRAQPLGQGERNYLIGDDLYVVVGPVTYRYDVLNLGAEPTKMTTAPAATSNPTR